MIVSLEMVIIPDIRAFSHIVIVLPGSHQRLLGVLHLFVHFGITRLVTNRFLLIEPFSDSGKVLQEPAGSNGEVLRESHLSQMT